MIFTHRLMSFYLDTIGYPKQNDQHNPLWEVFASFVAYRKGFDCSLLFADITAKGNPHSDFTYLRKVSDNELLDLVQGNGDQTRIDIAKFDDVVNFICRKACNDINDILRSVEAPCFARINGFEVIIELRGDTKESIHLGPAEAVAYIAQLAEAYAKPVETKEYLVEQILAFALAIQLKRQLKPSKGCLVIDCDPLLEKHNIEWLKSFDNDELQQLTLEVKAAPIDKQQAVIYKWHQTAIVRQSKALDTK
jgi:hypothetical protein